MEVKMIYLTNPRDIPIESVITLGDNVSVLYTFGDPLGVDVSKVTDDDTIVPTGNSFVSFLIGYKLGLRNVAPAVARFDRYEKKYSIVDLELFKR